MKFPETQNTKTENNVHVAENTFENINVPEARKSQSIKQVQKHNAIANQNFLNRLVGYGLLLVILASFLFIVAIYYGIIKP
ncbi:hypothetical protein VF14_10555 [Nostoc linckia z18]|uniref:Uncharacterized protein n=2 Tax=Nostoc linckia TaxID=92942 RepID=A0A9Q6EMJ9_NOSLI|nr:hypothetical protein [Nostoc linckia]PHK32427.1 hypothetical protein VF12_26740 [Nostoc linckia z15]PHK47638.1 hypothetical protein VF13_04165 [Nostoc linckia z16]PHJ58337.1 hypothetical protein VF02_28095 [Nostoc linckia z1]PHJ60907.1 hypothetical protein VF03_32860 [Nostoc linckia z2]PHJ67091.1 hypothetical protein VF05_17755 [Nostoc linckia z3]